MKGEVRTISGKRVASPEYRSWQMMRNRCLNPRATDYAYYGGRRIAICKKWETFEGFLEDMGRKPSAKHTLDRKNGNGHYCKSNCRWATRTEQSRNRRGYVYLSLAVARKVRALYATGNYRQIDLAERFGTNQINISQIMRGLVWKEGARCKS